MSEKEFDPLSKLFAPGEMERLSVEEQSTQKLEEALPAVSEQDDESSERRRPVQPPRPSAKKSQSEKQVALALALAQQAKAKAMKNQVQQDEVKQRKAAQPSLEERISRVVPQKKMSAMELFMAQMESEETVEIERPSFAKKSEKKPNPQNAVSACRLVEQIMKRQLPSLKEYHVAKARSDFNTALVQALWLGYQSKFVTAGKLQEAIVASTVLQLLKIEGSGRLIAAFLETTTEDYVVWIDSEEQRIIGLIQDAKTYYPS